VQELSNEIQYSEWVLPKWTSFLPVLIIYPTIWLTMLPINEAVGVWIGIVLTALFPTLMIMKAAKISVTPRHLRVGNASIERKFVTGVQAIEGEDAFFARGRELDSRAFIHFQGSVKTLIKVDIADAQDPTPYWLFSTRHPKKLAKALGF
jgi:Protein of unknown function (DUF3093)